MPQDPSDILELEWFECKRRKLIRKTQAGFTLELRLPERQQWHHGDALYSAGDLVAFISLKPCLTIVFTATNKTEAADFCYYIGNRHLPIFTENNHQFKVSYDGPLYEQLLKKYTTQIQLVEARLVASKALQNLTKKKAI